MIESLKREVQTLQQMMAKKSSAAQKLLQDRENECRELRKGYKELKREVDQGSLSDRRIFELAANQSNRETAAAAEIEVREKMMERFAKVLAERDGDLASAEVEAQRAGSKGMDATSMHQLNLDTVDDNASRKVYNKMVESLIQHKFQVVFFHIKHIPASLID